jgi:hypothetical protein
MVCTILLNMSKIVHICASGKFGILCFCPELVREKGRI